MAIATSENLATDPQEIILQRLIDAPRDLVFAAWSEPSRFERWFGPRGFTTKVHAMDFRVGGLLRYTMTAPDGTEFPNHTQYREIEAPARLYYLHGSKDNDPDAFEVTVTFEDIGGKTRLTMRMRLPSEAACAHVKGFGAVELGYQTITKLEELLATASVARVDDEEFVITRIVKAPRDLVWKAFTESERLAKWFGPKGCTVTHGALDLKVGSVYHYCLRMPDGMEMWGLWKIREVTPPRRLVVISSFSDKDGAVQPIPFPDMIWPLETLSTTILDDLGDRTRITVRWAPHNATAEQRAGFKAGHASMQQGWSGNFDVLDDYLRKVQA